MARSVRIATRTGQYAEDANPGALRKDSGFRLVHRIGDVATMQPRHRSVLHASVAPAGSVEKAQRRSHVTDRISVLLVDDHALVRRGFRRLLEDDPGIVVVGEAADGDTAIQLAAAIEPRVVILDCAMPRMNGLTATRKILELCPSVAIVMLTVHNETHVLQQAIAAGVRGFVTKGATDVNLAEIVRRVAAGETVFDLRASHATPAPLLPTRQLSPRQREVLRLICQGLSTRAIAETLGLSVNTIDVHRARIMKTLGVHRSAELVVHAIRHGLVEAP